MMFKRNLLTLVFFITATGLGFAQAPPQNDAGRSAVYLFAAPGVFSNRGVAGVLHVGGGGDVLIKSGFGVMADVGYVTVFEGIDLGLGVFTAGGLYQFRRDRRTVPFVTGGYTMLFRSEIANLIHFGGGVNRWLNERWGFRVEVRDTFHPDFADTHAVQVRFGVLIRP